MRLQKIVCLAALFALGGCVPFQIYDTPALTGTVLDSATQVPVAGAQIRIVPTGRRDLAVVVTSDAAGHFDAPSITHTLWLPPLPFDMPLWQPAHIEVSAPGYAPRSERLSSIANLRIGVKDTANTALTLTKQ